MGLRLEPISDHTRRVRGRDYDDVTRTHAASLAHVEARIAYTYFTYCSDGDFDNPG